MYILWEAGGTCSRIVCLKKSETIIQDIICEKHNPKEGDFAFLERHLSNFGFFPKNSKWINHSGDIFEGLILAIAGVISDDGSICATNRTCKEISYTSLKERYHLKDIILMNDVQTQGLYIPKLSEKICSGGTSECVQLNDVSLAGNFLTRPKFLISLGTGLGACVIHYQNNTWISEAGEYGQNLPPRLNEEEEDIACFMKVYYQNKPVPTSRLTLENFVSGTGLSYLYQAWADKMDIPVRKEKAIEICKMATMASDKKISQEWIALRSIESMMHVLARFIHNVGRFSIFPTGGIYLAGKILTENEFISNYLHSTKFLNECYAATRTLPEHAKKIPLFLVKTEADKIGMRGLFEVYLECIKLS